jgi:maltooligosyltrehalose trehalohydrolase
VLYDFHRELLRLRNGLAPLANLSKKSMTVTADRAQNLLQVRRWHRDESACLIFHFHDETSVIRILLPDGDWHRVLDSGEPRWEGPGSQIPEHLHATGAVELTPAPWSVTVFRRRVPGR